MVRKRTVRTPAGTTARALVITLALALSASACSDGSDDSGEEPRDQRSERAKEGPAIRVDHATARADQPVQIEVTGLDPRARVTIDATAKDLRDQTWAARGAFTASSDGTVDLAKATPRGGRPYQRADSMGLLSSMLPRGGGDGGGLAKAVGSGKAFSFHTEPPEKQRSYQVRLTVREGTDGKGKRLDERTLTRQWLPEGARHRTLSVARDKVNGELYAPPKGSRKKAPVLLFGGSEGGNAGTFTAAQLAAHGHPTLALCYFKCGKGSERPNRLNRIDLDYFEHAARLLRKQPAADSERLAVVGNSRGSEVAQLLGQRRPELVRDVVVYAPSAKVIGPFPSGTTAWLDGGKPIPRGPIPLNRVRGSVLAIGGGNDKMWDSERSSKRIAATADSANGAGGKGRALTYPGAGHHVNWFPYGQPGQEGGADGTADAKVRATSAADQRSRADSWPQVLKLLNR